MSSTPHRRYNPLADEWVLVSPQRTQRPWQGRIDDTTSRDRTRYDPQCYLCPGNVRASGEINDDYETTFSFTNDFAALQPDSKYEPSTNGRLLTAEGVKGTSRVLCFSPRHDLTMAEMGKEEVEKVVELWQRETAVLGSDYEWVQVFENKGEQMGASNPHPHGQVWALDSIPTRPGTEDRTQREYHGENNTRMLIDYVEQETKVEDRIVYENDEWSALVPWWAVWPYEALLIPRHPVSRLSELSDESASLLADGLRQLLIRYDNLFEHPFPYSMGWHGAPGRGESSHWQLHAHFNPPLLRSAAVRKFMVGFEMFGESQRDLTPESAAAQLRNQPPVRYSS